MAVSRAAVERASGPAAAEAPVELAAARDKISRANAALANKDYVLARQLAEQAEADAALAEARARASRSDVALGAVRESIRLLRLELNRS
jgi:predicted  nucleic acid-binding Zn-ribbon protein